MSNWNYQTQYGTYRTRRFSEIFPDKEAFRTEYLNIGIGGFSNDETLNTLYVLLYARRGNDAIMSSDETRFKYDLFSIIYKYGAEYEKKKEIQDAIKNLSNEELERGTTSINNHALNPSTVPQTQEFEQLKKIDSQTATGFKHSRIEALNIQAASLDTSYIEKFLSRFDRLFNPYPAEFPLNYYVGDDNND